MKSLDLNLILKAALAAAVIATAPAADAAVDYLLKLDGIKGESQPKASMADFHFHLAMASGVFNPFHPALAGGMRVAAGDLDGDGTWERLSVTATDPDDGVFFRYEMKEVHVTSFRSSADSPTSPGKWVIESKQSPVMRWAPPTATGGRGDWIEATWDADSGRLIGDPAVLRAFDDLGAVVMADGTLVLTSAVPEPATWAMALVGAAALGLRRLRQAA